MRLQLSTTCFALTLFVSTGAFSQQVGTDKHEAPTKNVQDNAQQQTDRTTQFQTQIIETIRRIADQQKATTEQSDASQKAWDSPAVLVNIGLLIVGGIYTLFACRQWLAIRDQVNLERPWIMIEADWPLNTTDPDAEHVAWSAINAGRSPAFITRLSVKAEPLPHPLPEKRPQYPDAKPFAEFIIAPNGGRHSSKYYFPLDAGRRVEYHRGEVCIAFYGCIEYHDFRKAPHATRFCVYWGQEGTAQFFSPVGPSDWIKYK